MSTSAFRYPNHPPTLHRPEPMREGFAWWRKIHVSYPPSQRKIGDNCFETGPLAMSSSGRPAYGQVKRQVIHSNPHSPLPILTRLVHPAVSSLEACPTPALRVLPHPGSPVLEGRHLTTLNISGQSKTYNERLVTFRE